MADTYGDLITDALIEIRAARAGDDVNPEDMALGLRRVNRILDVWNADRRAVYSESFTDFTLTPALSPHTIGPSGTWSVTQRPVSIEAITINIGGSPASYAPVRIRDDAWYAMQPVPALTTSLPTDAYYSQDWPNGKLYFWPIPTVAYVARVWMRGVLAAVAQTDDIALPPGYRDALTLTLAEALAPSFGQAASPQTQQAARHARALVFHNNDDVPRIATADSGLGMSHRGAGFNWTNRSWS